MNQWFLLVIVTLVWTGPVPTGAPVCDTSAIRWFYPDQFESACEAAKTRQRILLIKGISFGIDEAGARCATKGRW